MRRTILAVTLGSVILTTVACGTAKHTEVTGQATPGVGTSAAGQPAAATETKAFCEGLGEVYDKNMGPLAEALSRMVANPKAASTKAQAAQALSGFAAAVRGATEISKDPQLRADGKQAADQLQARSKDAAFFQKIQSAQDVNTVLGPTLKQWLAPVTHHCS